MQILNEQQIQQKIKRLAIQILEEHYKEAEIILAGINNNGANFANLLHNAIQTIDIQKPNITQTNIRLNPADPLERQITIELPFKELDNKVIIVVDDVANTGRTLFYAMKPILNHVIPKKLEVAVLVDRKHKAFPIHVDYVGLTLATTLSENIEVRIREVAEMEVNLN